MISRVIDVAQAEQAILACDIIEECPDDRYNPGCLIYGDTPRGRPLHVLCSVPPRVQVITVYQPYPREWEGHRTRRA
jgi:hypothetical protein